MPERNITREQMAAIFYRYAQFKGLDTSARADLSVFTDSSKVNSYAVPAMQWAVGSGLIQGRADKTLDPAGNATRAQVAAILTRFFSGNILRETEGFSPYGPVDGTREETLKKPGHS